jgi:hypothetical protein
METKKELGVITNLDKIQVIMENNPNFTVGKMTQTEFKAKLENYKYVIKDAEDAKLAVVAKQDIRQDTGKEMSKLSTVSKSAVRAYFGPDSPEFDQAGCKRDSERKPKRSSKEPKK